MKKKVKVQPLDTDDNLVDDEGVATLGLPQHKADKNEHEGLQADPAEEPDGEASATPGEGRAPASKSRVYSLLIPLPTGQDQGQGEGQGGGSSPEDQILLTGKVKVLRTIPSPAKTITISEP